MTALGAQIVSKQWDAIAKDARVLEDAGQPRSALDALLFMAWCTMYGGSFHDSDAKQRIVKAIETARSLVSQLEVMDI